MEFSPYVTWYEKTATKRPSYPTLNQDETCDICIVGGAFTGISALLYAAELGKKVILLEPGKVGFGCTGRSGGLIESGLNTTLDDLAHFHGRLNAHTFWNSTIEARDIIMENIKKYQIDCNLVKELLYISRDKKNRDDYVEYANYFSRYFENDPVEVCDYNEVQGKINMPSAALGLNYAKNGTFNPLSYLFGLAEAAVENGAKIYENTTVVSIDEAEKVVVKTNSGNIICDQVFMCGGAFMGMEKSPEKTQTVRTGCFQIVTKPLHEDVLNKIAPNGHVAISSRGGRGLRSYIETTHDGRIMYGGPEFKKVRNKNTFAQSKLKELLSYLPDLKGHVEIDYAWAGPVGAPMNFTPVLNKISSRHFVAHGFNGHGVAVSCFAGQVIIDEMMEVEGLYDIYARIKPRDVPQWVHHAIAKVSMIIYRIFSKRFSS